MSIVDTFLSRYSYYKQNQTPSNTGDCKAGDKLNGGGSMNKYYQPKYATAADLKAAVFAQMTRDDTVEPAEDEDTWEQRHRRPEHLFPPPHCREGIDVLGEAPDGILGRTKLYGDATAWEQLQREQQQRRRVWESVPSRRDRTVLDLQHQRAVALMKAMDDANDKFDALQWEADALRARVRLQDRHHAQAALRTLHRFQQQHDEAFAEKFEEESNLHREEREEGPSISLSPRYPTGVDVSPDYRDDEPVAAPFEAAQENVPYFRKFPTKRDLLERKSKAQRPLAEMSASPTLNNANKNKNKLHKNRRSGGVGVSDSRTTWTTNVSSTSTPRGAVGTSGGPRWAATVLSVSSSTSRTNTNTILSSVDTAAPSESVVRASVATLLQRSSLVNSSHQGSSILEETNMVAGHMTNRSIDSDVVGMRSSITASTPTWLRRSGGGLRGATNESIASEVHSEARTTPRGHHQQIPRSLQEGFERYLAVLSQRATAQQELRSALYDVDALSAENVEAVHTAEDARSRLAHAKEVVAHLEALTKAVETREKVALRLREKLTEAVGILQRNDVAVDDLMFLDDDDDEIEDDVDGEHTHEWGNSVVRDSIITEESALSDFTARTSSGMSEHIGVPPMPHPWGPPARAGADLALVSSPSSSNRSTALSSPIRLVDAAGGGEQQRASALNASLVYVSPTPSTSTVTTRSTLSSQPRFVPVAVPTSSTSPSESAPSPTPLDRMFARVMDVDGGALASAELSSDPSKARSSDRSVRPTSSPSNRENAELFPREREEITLEALYPVEAAARRRGWTYYGYDSEFDSFLSDGGKADVAALRCLDAFEVDRKNKRQKDDEEEEREKENKPLEEKGGCVIDMSHEEPRVHVDDEELEVPPLPPLELASSWIHNITSSSEEHIAGRGGAPFDDTSLLHATQLQLQQLYDALVTEEAQRTQASDQQPHDLSELVLRIPSATSAVVVEEEHDGHATTVMRWGPEATPSYVRLHMTSSEEETSNQHQQPQYQHQHQHQHQHPPLTTTSHTTQFDVRRNILMDRNGNHDDNENGKDVFENDKERKQMNLDAAQWRLAMLQQVDLLDDVPSGEESDPGKRDPVASVDEDRLDVEFAFNELEDMIFNRLVATDTRRMNREVVERRERVAQKKDVVDVGVGRTPSSNQGGDDDERESVASAAKELPLQQQQQQQQLGEEAEEGYDASTSSSTNNISHHSNDTSKTSSNKNSTTTTTKTSQSSTEDTDSDLSDISAIFGPAPPAFGTAAFPYDVYDTLKRLSDDLAQL